MATVSRVIAVTPEQVFAVLADGWSYCNWVTGTSHIRAVGVDWPAEGSRIHHASGIWPAVTRDDTVVEAVVPGERLVLTARGRPLGEARVSIRLRPEGEGTLVELSETPSAGLGKWLDNPVTEGLLARRNVESLARLAAVAERRAQPQD
jgi:uncharacterized protein YndB with AHSA1/START domain